MTTSFTPVFTDAGTQVIAPQCLVKGNLIRGTLDLLSTPRFGANVIIQVGRGGVTALATGLYVRVRKMLNNGGIIVPGGPPFETVTALTASILKLINNGPGYAAGTSAFTIDGTGTPAVNETYCCWGVTAVPANATALTTLEFLKISKQASGTSITVDSPCKQVKIDNELLTNLAETWTVWCEGGYVYEVILDFGTEANAEGMAVVAYAARYDSDLGT